MKQGRAFGVGVVVATQNSMDLDYRALGNAGISCAGRPQTQAGRQRVVQGRVSSGGGFELKPKELDATIARLSPRWFLLRNSHSARRAQCTFTPFAVGT